MRHALVFGYGQKKGGELCEQTINRCDKAIELYRAGELEKIYLTVSAVKDGHAMADKMKAHLVKAKIPAEAIIVDGRGHNTAGELDIFRSLVPKEMKLVLISTWYHIPRIIWLALWRMSSKRFTTAVAWKHAHFKGDFLVEFAKMANAVFRPMRCSKLQSFSHSYDLTEIPSREEILAAYRAKQPLVFKWLMPPAGEEILESRILIMRAEPSSESSMRFTIVGRDLNVKQGSNFVGLSIDFRTNKGAIAYA